MGIYRSYRIHGLVQNPCLLGLLPERHGSLAGPSMIPLTPHGHHCNGWGPNLMCSFILGVGIAEDPSSQKVYTPAHLVLRGSARAHRPYLSWCLGPTSSIIRYLDPLG